MFVCIAMKPPLYVVVKRGFKSVFKYMARINYALTNNSAIFLAYSTGSSIGRP